MGNRYVSNVPYYIEGNEQRFRELLAEYNENLHKFETKSNKAAGRRARKHLLELYHLCRTRRKEILEGIHEAGWVEHPSWQGIEEGE